MVELPITIAATFFMVGTITFIVGALLNLRIWLLGTKSIAGTIKDATLAAINPRFWLAVTNTLVVKIFGQNRLREIDPLRGVEKSSFVTFYVLVILVNHVAADLTAGITTIEAFVAEFFRSPFFPGYVFSEVGTQLSGAWVAYLLVDNFAMAMVFFFAEGLAMHRRFVKKHFMFATREDAIGLLLPVIWFIFRWIAEAATIVKLDTPPGSQYMFVAYLISRPLTLLTSAQIDSLYALMWPTSGFFLGLFVGSIPYSGRLWHALAGPLVMILNSAPARRRA